MHPLQKFDAVVESAVAGEIKAPRLSAAAEDVSNKARLKTVAGFVVTDEAAADERRNKALEQRREAAKTFRKDREILQKELAELEVTPLGFAPQKAWDYICHESGLYRLRFDKQGRTRAKKPYHPSHESLWVIPAGLALIVLACAFTYGTTVGTHWVATALGIGSDPAMFGAGVLGFAALMFSFMTLLLSDWTEGGALSYGVVNWFERQTMKVRLAFMDHKTQVKSVFPTGASLSNYSGMELAVTLPEPPADVAATILKLQGRDDIEVVAEADAIAFTPPLKEQALGAMSVDHAVRMAAAKERAALRADPIITIRKGSAVALVAQFGDFPIEEKVFSEAVATDHIL